MTPEGYVLSSLELSLRQGGLNVAMSNLTVTLRNASGNDPSSTVLATFVNPDSPALSTTFQTFRFTLSRSVALDPNTPYFIHLSNNHSSDSLGMASTDSDNEDSGGLVNWGIDDNLRRVSGSGWTNLSTSQAIKIRLNGEPQNSNNALEYLNIDDVQLYKYSRNGLEWYIEQSGILSITSTVTLRFKLDDPTATCEVKQSRLDLVNNVNNANLASATTVLASSSCSSNRELEKELEVNLPVGDNYLAVLVTAQDGVTQKHAVALSRPSTPSAVLLEGQATGWTIAFGSTVGSGGGFVHIRTWGDATPGVDYELFRQTGTSLSPTYVKLAAPNYATPMPSDGRVTIILNSLMDTPTPLAENREHVQIALYPATSGLPEHPVEAAILDNAVAVTFGAAMYTAAEGDTVAVTVNLSQDLGWDVVLPLTATNQNGATPADFEIPANVAITAGQTSATFTVAIVDDSIAESGESVALSFTGVLPTGIQAGSTATATVSIEGDNDTGEVVVSETELAIAEGESEVYTVSLGSQPTGAVTVTVAGHSGTDLTVSPTELIFTSQSSQTVTVTANPDLVQTSYVATLTHMVAGADYGANNVMAESVMVTVMNFTGGVAVSPTELEIAEGGSKVYTVSLGSQPTGTVEVTVAVMVEQDLEYTDLTVSPAELIFTSPSPQTVTVTANPDLELTDYVATLTHMVGGANYGANNVMAESVTVRVMDDQVVRRAIPPDGVVTVPPGGGMLAGTVVKLSLSEPEKYLLIFKEVAKLGLTDFPPGFMPDEESAVIVDITLVNAVTLMEVALKSPATVCLPTDRTGLRVYHYDADEASPMWMVLPIEDLEEDSACGVTESFSWFALGTAPSDAVEPWLARFGRTVAAHVVEAVSSRLATSTPQQEVTLGGMAPQSTLLSGALQTLSDGTVPDARALLSGSSFVLPLSGTGGAPWTVWGRGAYTEFDGREGDTRLDGEVLTSTIGLDWARDRWLAGVAVSHSEGDGDIRAESSSEEIDVSLTGAHPYLRYETEQGISIWGLLGWGEGDLERERDGVSSEVDLEMRMGALGARGRIASYKGFDLSLKSDALAVRLEADADAEEDAPELNADASRVRVLLEGAGHYPLKSGGSVVPILETGLRWDEGDAETGLGMELGARMRYSGVGSRLTAELMARALVMHEESAYDEWGVGGSVRLHADELGRGPSLKLESGYGAAESTTGQLWSESGLESFAGQDTSSPSRRFEMELGYGLNTAGGLGVWTPYVGLERLRTESVWRLGGRLELGETLSLQLQGLLRSPAQAVSEHKLSMHVSGRW